MKRFGFLILCFAITAHAIEAEGDADDFELPSGTLTCQIDSPHRDECIKEAIQDMLPRLKEGMPSLGIQPLDPFAIEERELSFKRGLEFFGSGSVKNFRLYGATSAKILDVRSNVTDTRLQTRFKVAVPHIYAEGFYRGEGRFNNLKFRSKGYFNFTADDITTIIRTDAVFIEKEGKKHLKLTHFDTNPTVGNMKFYATGILPDPEMNRVAVELVNQYWPYMYKDLIAETRDIWEPILVEDANKFLLHVPIQKILY